MIYVFPFWKKSSETELAGQEWVNSYYVWRNYEDINQFMRSDLKKSDVK